MTVELESALGQLLVETGADAAVVWRSTGPGAARVLTSSPPGLLADGAPWVAVDEGARPNVERDPARLARLVPTSMRLGLPAAPSAALSTKLGHSGLFLLVAWSGPDAVPAITPDIRRFIDAYLAHLAAVTEESRRMRGTADRLRAVIDGLDAGVASLDNFSGQATVNEVAGKLLNLPPGEVAVAEFAEAMAGLRRRAVNPAEIASAYEILGADPDAAISVTWRFPNPPTELRITSQSIRHGGFDGRVWTFHDESSLARALDSSEQTAALLRTTMDSLLDPVILLEPIRDEIGRTVDFLYLDVNQYACDYLQMARHDLIGHRLLKDLPNLEPSGLLELYVRCADSGQPVAVDNFLHDNELHGAALRYDIRANPATGGRIVVTWRDITERYEIARRIEQSEERFRRLMENSNIGICLTTPEGRFDTVNQALCDFFGYDADTLRTRTWQELTHPDYLTIDSEKVADVLAGRIDSYRLTKQYIRADGHPVWGDLAVGCIRASDGSVDRLISQIVDITDRVEAERRAAEARKLQAEADSRYRRLMDNSPIGMALVTEDGRLEEVNPAMCDFFGYDADTLRTKTWRELRAGDTLEQDLLAAEEVRSGRANSYRVTEEYQSSDGSPIWGTLSVSALRDADGRFQNFVSQIIDVTAEVTARKQLGLRDEQNRLLNERLQSLNERLTNELDSAASYIASVLPGELSGTVNVSARYLPSRELAGDCFDYRWIDDDHLISYVIDVSGHGIEPALVSMSVHNMLRSGSVPASTLADPGRLLTELNRLFQMDTQGGNYFTIWYGVYQASTRTLRYAAGGHPPALLMAPRADSGPATVSRLASNSPPLGMFEDTEFDCTTVAVPAASHLLIYSDGAYELPLPDGRMWSLDDFVNLVTRYGDAPEWSLSNLVDALRARTIEGQFDDDCSLVCIDFP